MLSEFIYYSSASSCQTHVWRRRHVLDPFLSSRVLPGQIGASQRRFRVRRNRDKPEISALGITLQNRCCVYTNAFLKSSGPTRHAPPPPQTVAGWFSGHLNYSTGNLTTQCFPISNLTFLLKIKASGPPPRSHEIKC